MTATPGPKKLGPVRWGLGDAVVGYPAAIVLSVLCTSAWVSVAGGPADGYGALGAGQVGLWLGFLGVPWLATRWKGTGSLREDFGLEVQLRDAAVGIPAGLFAQLVLLPVIYLLLRLFTGPLDVDGPARELLDRGDGIGLAGLLLGVVAIAPIVEELFFRGLLMRALSARIGPKPAVVASALIFGATHFQLVQFLGLTAVGLVFGWLAMRAGRLGPAVWAHMSFNATAALALLLTR